MPEKQRNRGPASYDRTHNLQSYLVYDLPFGKGQQWATDGWASKVLGGFQVNGVMSLMSGIPFYVVQGNGFNLNAGGSSQVPDQVLPEVAILGGIGTTSQRGSAAGLYFDPTAYRAVNIPSGQTQRFGTAGRNNLRGPEFWEVDAGIFRTFSITETVKFQIRAEALNALNHANFANPNADVTGANFGFVTATYGPNQSRQWRFGARFSF